MMQQARVKKRWNLFARELEDLLQKRERDLNDLISEGGLHPEKVYRLKRSLATPKFHLLSPEDLEQVIATFQFTNEEQLRLGAAILATAIEETLMNRVDPDNALRAAEEIFPILVKALRQRFGQRRGLAATRREIMTEEITTNDVLEPALECFDQAMLALHLGQQGNSPVERMEQTQRACDGFAAVLTDLEALRATDPAIATTDAWKMWCQEAQKGLTVALERLVQL